jgi:hypothetical protein
MKVNRWPIPHNPVYKVGDRVLAIVGTTVGGKVRKVPGIVIEDRGPLGRGGRQIVRVRFLTDAVAPFEESEFPLEDLERDPEPA